MQKTVSIVGGGLAGSEAALSLAANGIPVRLYEMRPNVSTPVHHSCDFAELVCSNSLKSMREDSAAGMLKEELICLGSHVFKNALKNRVPAGGALAVDRERFAKDVTSAIKSESNIEVIRDEVVDLKALSMASDAIILATGPLTSDDLAKDIAEYAEKGSLAFYDAAAPIVMADSLNHDRLFRQSRYGESDAGDYLNASFSKAEYDSFIEALLSADRVISKDFETTELFQACQPIEEIARRGHDAPRFGTMKPVGLTDPSTGRRPWAALQLRAEDANAQSYNLVGFQTNLTFPEQRRVFRMIPGLENAEFARYGVMHRNTFIDAPSVIDASLQMKTERAKLLPCPVFVAGQLSGTEGYCEAIRSGLHAAISAFCILKNKRVPTLPIETVFGALIEYATNPQTKDYQPMHVNFGILPPLENHIRNKRERYVAYATRGKEKLTGYVEELKELGYASDRNA